MKTNSQDVQSHLWLNPILGLDCLNDNPTDGYGTGAP